LNAVHFFLDVFFESLFCRVPPLLLLCKRASEARHFIAVFLGVLFEKV